MQNLEQALSVSDLAALRRALRSVFSNSVESVEGVVSLAVRVTLDTPGLLVIEGEYLDASGHAVGGFGL